MGTGQIAPSTWGFRVGYGHRTGNDYVSGDRTQIPSSYNSRDLDLAVGHDLANSSHLEFKLLRLDQTNVEFPGYAQRVERMTSSRHASSSAMRIADSNFSVMSTEEKLMNAMNTA